MRSRSGSRDGAHQVVGGEFDPCDVIVVTDAQIGESHPTQAGLHLLDLAQLVRGDGPMVRYPRGQAGRGRLVRAGQLQGAGDPPHLQFGQPGVGERAQHVVVGRGAGTGPVGPDHVVGVLPVGDRVEPVGPDHLVGDAGEQLVLAVETPVRTVGDVLRALAFVGRHLRHHGADDVGDVVGGGEFVGGQAR